MALTTWLAISAAILLIALWKIVPIILQPLRSPLRHLSGPPNPGWLWGQFKEIFKAENSVLQEKWVSEYGHTIAYKGMFGVSSVLLQCHYFATDLEGVSLGLASVHPRRESTKPHPHSLPGLSEERNHSFQSHQRTWCR